MSDRVWHKGPPPFSGWWNASKSRNRKSWRWWEGGKWSVQVREDESAKDAQLWAEIESVYQELIEWTDYWPENARVPRLDPTGGHWTFNVDGKKPRGLPARIDLVFRNGQVVRGHPFPMLIWWRAGVPGDIIAWRPAA